MLIWINTHICQKWREYVNTSKLTGNHFVSEPPEKHFGAWVSEQRRATGMSEAECARRSGLTPQRWNNMEKQSRTATVRTAQRVADALELPLREVQIAAGLMIGEREGLDESHLGRRLELILQAVSGMERQHIERLIEADAKKYVGLVTLRAATTGMPAE
jgi:transcriptional regulator with XRE-family HTH domain